MTPKFTSLREQLVPGATTYVKVFQSTYTSDELEEQVERWVNDTGNLIFSASPVIQIDSTFGLSVVYLKAFDEATATGILAERSEAPKACCRLGDEGGECTNACAASDSVDEGVCAEPRAERHVSACGGP